MSLPTVISPMANGQEVEVEESATTQPMETGTGDFPLVRNTMFTYASAEGLPNIT